MEILRHIGKDLCRVEDQEALILFLEICPLSSQLCPTS